MKHAALSGNLRCSSMFPLDALGVKCGANCHQTFIGCRVRIGEFIAFEWVDWCDSEWVAIDWDILRDLCAIELKSAADLRINELAMTLMHPSLSDVARSSLPHFDLLNLTKLAPIISMVGSSRVHHINCFACECFNWSYRNNKVVFGTPKGSNDVDDERKTVDVTVNQIKF